MTVRQFPLLGDLIQHPGVPEWWDSQPVPIPFFSGKLLPFVFMEETGFYPYSADTIQAVKDFLSMSDADRIALSDAVFQNYKDFMEVVDEEELVVTSPTDIWNFVVPNQIYVSRRHRRDKDVYIQVACDCEWETEHGLQLVFRRGSKLVRVSEQDGHLTHADAYDLPEDQEVP